MTKEEKKTKTESKGKKEAQEEEILKDDFDSVIKNLLDMKPEPKKKTKK